MQMDPTQEEKIISSFLHSIGPWAEHIIIGGGYAPIIYKLYLANCKKSNPPVITRDVDSLIPRKIARKIDKNISNYLADSGFSKVRKDYENPATEAYTKEIAGVEIEIEFLTDASREGISKNISIAGIVAQPLRYLELSLETAKLFNTFSNYTGFVVAPEAWILHKGTFSKRSDKFKRYKDLYGIWYVATQLEAFSDEAISKLPNLIIKKSSNWAKTFKGNLVDWINEASPQDWRLLEAQDPFGQLSKLRFEQSVKIIIDFIT
jgi:Nucleotidyltransferase